LGRVWGNTLINPHFSPHSTSMAALLSIHRKDADKGEGRKQLLSTSGFVAEEKVKIPTPSGGKKARYNTPFLPSPPTTPPEFESGRGSRREGGPPPSPALHIQLKMDFFLFFFRRCPSPLRGTRFGFLSPYQADCERFDFKQHLFSLSWIFSLLPFYSLERGCQFLLSLDRLGSTSGVRGNKGRGGHVPSLLPLRGKKRDGFLSSRHLSYRGKDCNLLPPCIKTERDLLPSSPGPQKGKKSQYFLSRFF